MAKVFGKIEGEHEVHPMCMPIWFNCESHLVNWTYEIRSQKRSDNDNNNLDNTKRLALYSRGV